MYSYPDDRFPLRNSRTSTKSFGVPPLPPKATLPKPYSSLLLRQFPDEPTEKLWRDFLTRVTYPAHYDSPEFFLEPYWKYEMPFAVLLLCSGRVVAAITGFDQGREIVSGLGSRPQICIARDADVGLTSRTLADAMVSHFPHAKRFIVYSWGPRDLPGFVTRGFRKLELERCVFLDLRPGANSIFDNFPSNRRRDIRKAMRNGIQVKEATTDADFEAYWSVHSAWKRTSRKKINHRRDFAAMAAVQQMRANHRRFLAYYEGEVIAAAGVRFYPNGLVEFANNCSRDEYLHLCPNDLLVWTMIQWACENGFPRLSLGGAHPFLRKWSDTVIPVNRYRLDRTLLQYVEFKDEATMKARLLIQRMPTRLQTALRMLLRRAA